MNAEEFDQHFESGEDMLPYLDLAQAKRPGREKQNIKIELPVRRFASFLFL